MKECCLKNSYMSDIFSSFVTFHSMFSFYGNPSFVKYASFFYHSSHNRNSHVHLSIGIVTQSQSIFGHLYNPNPSWSPTKMTFYAGSWPVTATLHHSDGYQLSPLYWRAPRLLTSGHRSKVTTWSNTMWVFIPIVGVIGVDYVGRGGSLKGHVLLEQVWSMYSKGKCLFEL